MGKHQLRLLKFAIRYQDGWHSLARGDEAALSAVRSLERLGLLEVARHPRPAQWQFRLAGPEREPVAEDRPNYQNRYLAPGSIGG